MVWVRHGVSLLLAAFMLFMGSQKFGINNAVFQYISEQSGIALFEPAIRMAVGGAEILAGLLLIAGVFLPTFRGLGALLSLGVIGGAIVFHLSPWLGIVAPVGFDRGGRYIFASALFVMAIVFFAVAALATWLDRDALIGRFGKTSDVTKTGD